MDSDIEGDDDIFFGLPEEEIDLNDIPILDLEEAEFVHSAPSTSSRGAKKTKSKGKPAKVNTPRLPCPHCTKSYANERTLKTHLTSVRLKAMASRAPDVEFLHEKMKDLAVAALLQVKESLTIGSLAEECADYANRLAVFIMQCDASSLVCFLAKELINIFNLAEVAFLSNLRDMVTHGTNKLLNNFTFRRELKRLLVELIECCEGTLNFFIGNFIVTLCNLVLISVCQKLQDRALHETGPCKRSKDDFSSVKFKELVHYIGGSVVNGINRRKRNYPTSTQICSFVSVVNKSFVEDKEDSTTWCEEEVKAWTVAQDRGGLCYISKNAFTFFYELICFVMCQEEEDGSVIIDKVSESVSSQFEILGLWDQLVGSEMEVDTSLEWLSSIVEVVCRCVSKGIIKRRLNDALKKPVSNVAHRPRLAR